MRAIGRQLSILVLGTAVGALGRAAVADDAACQAVLDAGDFFRRGEQPRRVMSVSVFRGTRRSR